MKPVQPLRGLVAATHTPFAPDGSLKLEVIEMLAAHLVRNGIHTVFINGTTGECTSLSVEERMAVAQRWFEVARGTGLNIAVHVGTNSLEDSCRLAAHADQLGAASISAFAPSYFKPTDLQSLISWCARIAAAAAETPFYFYDIPGLTGVALSMPDFLDQAPEHLPTLAGLKFSNPDLMAYQLCLAAAGGRFDIAFGCDEWMLAALVLGGKGAVGSTYNFAAPIYHRIIQAFEAGDLDSARREQLDSARLVRVLQRHGYMGAAKALMSLVGVDIGPPRLPHTPLSDARLDQMRGELQALELLAKMGL